MLLSGIVGLAISFALLMFVTLWVLIYSTKRSRALKLILIPFLIWYAVAVYYAPSNIVGWPIGSEPPDGSVVLSFQIDEPKAIYIWAVDLTYNPVPTIDPRGVTKYALSGVPRSYMIPYDRELHKEMIEAEKMKNERKFILRWFHEKKASPGNEKENDGGNWAPDKDQGRGHVEAQDPKKLLPKDLPTEAPPEQAPAESI